MTDASAWRLHGRSHTVPLPLDREFTTELLGFSRTQRNPLAVQNSRGRFELKQVRWMSDIAFVVEKFASDLMLFSTREFGFFSIPESFTTGSSLMPQKRNPDVIELLRAGAARIRAAEQELLWLIAKLTSSYHRDFQLTKEPLVRATNIGKDLLRIFSLIVQSLQVSQDRLRAAMTPDLYATYEAFRQVKGAIPFRLAYQDIAGRRSCTTSKALDLAADFEPLAAQLPGEVEAAMVELQKLETKIAEWRALSAKVENQVFAPVAEAF